jgi:hypothetical protein
VKSGGHASNPGFSSTTGILISMSRFSQVVYDGTSQTAVVGSGLNWDEVYTELEPYGVNAIGGRVTGVRVLCICFPALICFRLASGVSLSVEVRSSSFYGNIAY